MNPLSFVAELRLKHGVAPVAERHVTSSIASSPEAFSCATHNVVRARCADSSLNALATSDGTRTNLVGRLTYCVPCEYNNLNARLADRHDKSKAGSTPSGPKDSAGYLHLKEQRTRERAQQFDIRAPLLRQRKCLVSGPRANLRVAS